MCKKGVFERIKKEVEGEPRKLFWGIISFGIYIIRTCFFCIVNVFVGKKINSCFNLILTTVNFLFIFNLMTLISLYSH